MSRARSRPDSPVQESVLDRLIQEEAEGPDQSDPEVSLRRFKASVLRDIEWLLNTRRSHETGFEQFAELRRSVYGYGLPDLTSLRLDPESERLLAKNVEDALRAHEPRIARLRVSVAGIDPASRRLRLSIEGILKADPVSEPISFDTVLDMGTGEVRLFDA